MSDEFELSRRQLLGGMGAIGASGLGAGLGTEALLTDQESFTDNRLVAGELDLKVDWQERYNGDPVDAYPDEDGNHRQDAIRSRDEIAAARFDTTFDALPDSDRETVESAFRDQFADVPAFFQENAEPPLVELDDVKPGDSGGVTFSLHLFDNPGFISMTGALTANRERGRNEPEREVDRSPDAGELPGALRARIYYDETGDNEFDPEVDTEIVSGSLREVLLLLGGGVELDGNRSDAKDRCFPNSTTQHVGFEWWVPEDVGNEIQTDEAAFRLGFTAEQCRHRDGEEREFTIHAVPVDIVYNKFGLHQPNGAMYVLEENKDAVLDASGEPLGSTAATSLIEPLVIRANRGDTVRITFVNDLDEEHASIHQTGLPYDVQSADGMHVGRNPNTTVAPGESIEYTWHATREGAHFFADGVNQAWDSTPDGNPEEVNSMARGLFGALVVEPAGVDWTDPVTGGPLRSGTRADIHDPEGPDYREFVPFYHDPGEVVPERDHPGTDIPQNTHGINYRAEKTSERIGLADAAPEAFYSSWVHGDPGVGDTVFPAYKGDSVKFVAVGANLEENHVHHLHGHRWKEIDPLSESDTIDSQTIGAGSTYEAFLVAGHGAGTVRPDMSFQEAFDVGAGYVHGSVGDYLFHCHLFPHYGEGMNAFMRVHDKERPDLQPLPDNAPDIPLNADDPGWIEVLENVPGFEDGAEPPKPPNAAPGEPWNRAPSPAEQAAFDVLEPGAAYADPCVDPDAPTREYTIVALPADIVYNDAGDHDPRGRVFVLEEDAAAVRNGELNPEPLVIRANVGDCIELTLKNELTAENLPEGETPGAVSNHVHFVGFDPLAADSTMVGRNYDSGVEPGETGRYRWYADEKGTIFFHDHMVGVEEGMHGTFAALVVEPEGSTWRDTHTGEEIRTGTQAIIERPDGEDFRELVLQYQDFAPLVERGTTDEFVNPDVQHAVNAGTMAINYRNAPYYRRRDEDAAYVHSSAVHGDPPTPVFETYPGDPVRIRLLQGSHEEQHNFSMHGLRPDPEGFDPADSTSQIIGPSEAFTFQVREDQDFDHLPNPDGLPVRDYLYGSMVVDDLWDGMWGLHRVWGAAVDHVEPLPDRGTPSGSVSQADLEAMGHPAAFTDLATEGHRAKLTYDAGDDRERPPDYDERNNANVGSPPPKAPDPGDPCPGDAPVRQYDVTAFQTDIEYNDYGDHDPFGITFALDSYVSEIQNGDRPAEPLALRANSGDCIELTLTNDLPEDPDDDHAHPKMRTSKPWERSNRISLHPQRMQYDVNGSDGATVGFNFDQTIAPGESITYRWYADRQLSSCVLWDAADLRSNRHHGAFGRLVIEPEGSQFLDPATGEPMPSGSLAMVKNPNGEDFREFALAFSDKMYVVNPDGSCVVPRNPDADDQAADDPCNQVGDAEDQGYVGVNNRSEPFRRRFDTGSDDQRLVFDSDEHGDPNTPVLNAYLNEPIRIDLSHVADGPRGVSFHLAGHQWERYEGVPQSPWIGVDDRFMPGKNFRIDPVGDAGGLLEQTGDFIYQEMKHRRRLEAGQWGILRVQERPRAFADPVQPLPDFADRVPLRERPGWVVATGDVTGDGTTEILVGVPGSDLAGVDAGAAYLFYGPTDESELTDLAGADAQFLGANPGDRAGADVALGAAGIATADSEDESTAIVIESATETYVFDGTDRPTGTIQLGDS